MIKKSKVIILGIVFCVFLFGCSINDDAVLSINTRSIQFEESDYGNSMGNNSCNLISQLPTMNGCIVEMDAGNYIIDLKSLKIDYLCSKLGCSHDKPPCVSYYDIVNLQSYKNMILCRCLDLSRTTIYSIENNEIKPYIDLEEEIEYFIRYKDYLIVTGITKMLKVDLKTKEVLEINQKPGAVGCINCYNDKIYFCEYDFYLYEMELDGSNKRLLAKQAMRPQVVDSKLYYLERNESTSNFAYRLRSINLETGEVKLILDSVETHYNYCISNRHIFYVSKDDSDIPCLYKFNMDTSKTILLKKEYRGSVYVSNNSEWIFEVVQYDEGGNGISSPYINAIKKDGAEVIKIEPKIFNKN